MLTVDTIPLCRFGIVNFGFRIFQSSILNPKSEIGLLAFSVRGVTATATAELFELKPVRRALFVLGRHVIALFALRAL